MPCPQHRGYVGTVSTVEPDGRVTEDICPVCDEALSAEQPVSREYQREVDRRLAKRQLVRRS